MIQLSIVIPVYNVEKYVERCIRSCAQQDISLNEYEIIVINDGTQDDSFKIAEKVAKDYKNIKLHSQNNVGLSEARNKGLSLSSGKYIWFVDSDDWIQKNCLQEVLRNIAGKDTLAMGYIETHDDQVKNKEIKYEIKAHKGKQLLLKTFFPQVQLYVFRREFLIENKLSFYKGIFHEDSEFTPRMLYYSEKLKILDRPIYYFYKRPNSISTTPNPKRAFDCITVAQNLKTFKNQVEPSFYNKFDNLISLVINNALWLSYDMKEEDKQKLNKHIYKNANLFKNMVSSSVLKYKIEGYLFKLRSRNTISTYKFIQRFNF